MWYVLSFTNTDLTSVGENPVHQAEPPCLVRPITSGRLPGIPEHTVHDRLTHCLSSPMHGAHTDELGLFFKVYFFISTVFCANRVTSHRMWLFTTHSLHIYHPWRIGSSLRQADPITLQQHADPGTGQPTPLDPHR